VELSLQENLRFFVTREDSQVSLVPEIQKSAMLTKLVVAGAVCGNAKPVFK